VERGTKMREAILLAVLAAVVMWLLDPLLGSFLRGFVGYLLSRTVPGLLPRSVRGHWTTTFLLDGKQVDECVLARQLVDRVWGRITLDAKKRKYRFQGSIRSDVLVATYELNDAKPQAMDRGSFTLKLNNDGDRMVGCFSWTCDKTGEVRSDKYEWKRVQTATD